MWLISSNRRIDFWFLTRLKQVRIRGMLRKAASGTSLVDHQIFTYEMLEMRESIHYSIRGGGKLSRQSATPQLKHFEKHRRKLFANQHLTSKHISSNKLNIGKFAK
ncbi:uncharacterized protein LOC117232857 [Bombus vosnesenskii]|uniref:Uncharacterized protein LOC117232857 n=1 Tax=Bombus vosnesenskii TaxID=207650 RepID=A0A6J3K8S6_9HYME|nr:uncharacterized protein LOC117232857 [Bombus vosnesenskii]